jgi:hypothetical protein
MNNDDDKNKDEKKEYHDIGKEMGEKDAKKEDKDNDE